MGAFAASTRALGRAARVISGLALAWAGLVLATAGIGPVAAESDPTGGDPQAFELQALDLQDIDTRDSAAVPDQAELDQMLAPIALYPDALLAQTLLAATYPLDVVEAARWTRDYPNLDGAAAVEAAGEMGWDPSVQALAAFPDILARMNENLRWTRRLGAAFLADGQRVMATVQEMRGKADAAGNLAGLEHARVIRHDNVIVIESAQPQRIYVPYYNPAVIYGPWWRPAYPPVYWRPRPGYQLDAGFYWGGGIHLSTASIFFSTFDWQRHQVVVLNPRLHPHRTRLISGRYPVGYYHSRGFYRDPGKHGFERWRHRPEHRRAHDRDFENARRIDRGSYSPTGSYIRPAIRPEHRPGHRRDAESPARSRAGQAPAERRGTGAIQLRRSDHPDIQFRRGDPHRARQNQRSPNADRH